MNTRYEAFLNTQIEDDNNDLVTVREYLHKLLKTLWLQGESFNGKRPFGNSGWEYDLYKACVIYDNRLGTLDEFGYVKDFDGKQCNKLIIAAIDSLFETETDK